MGDFSIHEQPLPYADRLDTRTSADIDLVVIHCTELPDLAEARRYGEQVLYDSGTGNSGHYYIDRDGRTVRYVPDTRIAHHVRGYNARAIGIELVNTGRYPHWLAADHQAMDETYTDAQLDALRALLVYLKAEHPTLTNIAGHEDLDTQSVPASDNPHVQVRRKRDPGPRFPWPEVLAGCPLARLPE
ncbi:N-acetylmuramoyl-L-alanine amidase [Oleiagrimonas sp. C23AA]|uniref:N-acetylmuramoyl-L-alanine amidase n=1 Tax=Oleiagrimonas sp. C23AA TaxID=2719047 RepID=UPI001423D6E3|nr:N-acetylmuramoyl-L-alanine amidase [Oleiagrimonas sp. C23AA]NII09071.1 N-acetylmuramoyl-L-alanine amidase [Oleiagrimonas sp. C23AA]